MESETPNENSTDFSTNSTTDDVSDNSGKSLVGGENIVVKVAFLLWEIYLLLQILKVYRQWNLSKMVYKNPNRFGFITKIRTATF